MLLFSTAADMETTNWYEGPKCVRDVLRGVRRRLALRSRNLAVSQNGPDQRTYEPPNHYEDHAQRFRVVGREGHYWGCEPRPERQQVAEVQKLQGHRL